MAPPSTNWLTAIARAWPLLSPLAFREALADMEHFRVGRTHDAKGRTRLLQSELEDELRNRSSGASLRALTLLRERAWHEGSRTLGGHFRTWSMELIRHHAGQTCVAHGSGTASHSDLVDQWRWASLAVPPETLVALCGENDVVEGQVDLCDNELRSFLNAHSVAETHVHLGATFSFGDAWATLMRDPRSIDTSTCSPRALPFASTDQFAGALEAAFLARVMLAWRLDRGAASFEKAAKDLSSNLEPGEAEAWGREFVRVTRSLTREREGPRIVARPSRALLDALVRKLADIRFAEWVRLASGKEMELRLLAGGVRELDARRGCEWRTLLWQYQRIRATVYRWLVIDPGTAGLDWFQRYYARAKALPSVKDQVGRAWRLERVGLVLSSLEVRAAWPKDDQGFRGLALDAMQVAGECEVGIVLHWLKSTARSRARENTRTRVRFGDWYQYSERRLSALRDALERYPFLLVAFRGFDVAGNERLVPNWILTPLFARARLVGTQASSVLSTWFGRKAAAGMRATIHVGEDFHCLQEGVRRVGELFERGILRHADRIGHALALGIDAQKWMD
jgi:hypothetical protein